MATKKTKKNEIKETENKFQSLRAKNLEKRKKFIK